MTKANLLSTDTASLQQTVEGALNIMEAVAIAVSEPKLNLQRGRWSSATQYFQFVNVDEDSEQ